MDETTKGPEKRSLFNLLAKRSAEMRREESGIIRGLEQILNLSRIQLARNFVRAMPRFALFYLATNLFFAQAKAQSLKGPIEVGVFPYYGIAVLRSQSIDNMNARLGNSPRLEHPLGFGNQDIYGGNLQVWTNKRKYGFGLGFWSSEASLRGQSEFEGVSGAATLSLTSAEGVFSYRVAPTKSIPRQFRTKWYRNFNLYLGVIAGYGQVNFKNSIEDRERNLSVNYLYTSERLTAGGLARFIWEAYPWLNVIVADINFRQLVPIRSSTSVVNYRISGRDESALAPEQLTKDFDKAILIGVIAIGLEFSF